MIEPDDPLDRNLAQLRALIERRGKGQHDRRGAKPPVEPPDQKPPPIKRALSPPKPSFFGRLFSFGRRH